MKKTLALLLALVMVFALCACGSSDDDSAEEAEEEAVVEEVEEEEEVVADAAAPVDESEDEEEPEDEEEVPAGAAVEGGSSGEASGEASGEMGTTVDVESYLPDQGDYSKDFEGYREYCIDGYMADSYHPEELEEGTLAELNDTDITEENYMDTNYWSNLVTGSLGVVLTYDEFLEY